MMIMAGDEERCSRGVKHSKALFHLLVGNEILFEIFSVAPVIRRFMAVTPGTEPKVMRKAENAAPIVRGEILLQPGALRPAGTIFGTVQRNQVPLRAAAFG